MTGLIPDKDWPSSIYIQNEVELPMWMIPEPQACDYNRSLPPHYETETDREIERSRVNRESERSRGPPPVDCGGDDDDDVVYICTITKSKKPKAGTNPNAVKGHQAPKRIPINKKTLLDQPEYKYSVVLHPKAVTTAENSREIKQEPIDEPCAVKQEPLDTYEYNFWAHPQPHVGQADNVKEEPLDEFEYKPSIDPLEDYPSDWIAGYLSRVARTGKTPMPWSEVRKEFLKYAKVRLR